MADAFGEDNPFQNMFGDLGRLFQNQGPVSWDAATQLALNLATDGEPEPNIDPMERIALEELSRVADLQVSNATGLPTSTAGAPVTLLPVNRTQWVQRSIPAYKPMFTNLAQALSPDAEMPDQTGADPLSQMLGPLMHLMTPMMLGVTAGSMLGHLARRSFGQYDLPIPRPPSDEILVVVPNLDAFAQEWSLPADDLRLWICVHEIAHHAVLGVHHVRERLTALVNEYLASFDANPSGLEDLLGDIDISDPTALEHVQSAFSDPQLMLGAIQSDAQRELLPQLGAVVAVVVGYVDFTMDRIGGSLIPSYARLTEALRRRRVEASPSDRFVEQLFGLELTRDRYERASSFIGGVVERGGPEALDRLWARAELLPTPAEIEAPGLWLARIEYED